MSSWRLLVPSAPEAIEPEIDVARSRGHLPRVDDGPQIPTAPVADLDLDQESDEQEWERRVVALATSRIRSAEDRLRRLGIIDDDGELVSTELPPDMEPGSDTTVETG